MHVFLVKTIESGGPESLSGSMKPVQGFIRGLTPLPVVFRRKTTVQLSCIFTVGQSSESVFFCEKYTKITPRDSVATQLSYSVVWTVECCRRIDMCNATFTNEQIAPTSDTVRLYRCDFSGDVFNNIVNIHTVEDGHQFF